MLTRTVVQNFTLGDTHASPQAPLRLLQTTGTVLIGTCYVVTFSYASSLPSDEACSDRKLRSIVSQEMFNPSFHTSGGGRLNVRMLSYLPSQNLTVV